MKVTKYLRLINRLTLYIGLLILCVSCSKFIPTEAPTRTSVAIASATPAPSIASITPGPIIEASPHATNYPDDMLDALPVMQGICFEAAWDAAGTVFIMRSAEEHIHFYDLADNSKLCRHAVERYPFDFSQGDVLAGLWNRGTGCTAQHTLTGYERNYSKRTIKIDVKFIIEGDCNYELVRGFWLGIPNAHDYEITLHWSE